MGRAAGLLLAMAAIVLGGCGGGGRDGDATAGGSPARTEPRVPPKPKPPLPAAWSRGVNLTAYADGSYAEMGADEALGALKALGGTHVAIVVTWYMADETSSNIRPEPDKSPSDASVLYALRTAQALGLEVTLKPHVDVLDGTFRGRIAPGDEAAWFSDYTAFVTRTAKLAQRVGAERFIVGSELTSMARRTAAFRRVIAAARAAFPGRMTYAANWVQEAEDVAFWDALDEVGIDAYMPLTDENQPSEDDLVESWEPWKERFETLAQETGKPVLLTELGYAARSSAAAEPASEEKTSPIDPALQERLYAAANRALADTKGLSGIFWWDWPADGRTAPGSYSPRNSPAQAVLGRFWARPDLAPPPGTTGPSGPTGASGATGPTG